MTRAIDTSPEANRRRSAAAKRGAKARAEMLLRRAAHGPEGSARGSAMLDPADSTIPAILDRLKARSHAQGGAS